MRAAAQTVAPPVGLRPAPFMFSWEGGTNPGKPRAPPREAWDRKANGPRRLLDKCFVAARTCQTRLVLAFDPTLDRSASRLRTSSRVRRSCLALR